MERWLWLQGMDQQQTLLSVLHLERHHQPHHLQLLLQHQHLPLPLHLSRAVLLVACHLNQVHQPCVWITRGLSQDPSMQRTSPSHLLLKSQVQHLLVTSPSCLLTLTMNSFKGNLTINGTTVIIVHDGSGADITAPTATIDGTLVIQVDSSSVPSLLPVVFACAWIITSKIINQLLLDHFECYARWILRCDCGWSLSRSWMWQSEWTAFCMIPFSFPWVHSHLLC